MPADIAFEPPDFRPVKNLQQYIDRQKSDYLARPLPPDSDAAMIVVVPCYDEPQLQETLKNLRASPVPADTRVMVVVIVNSSARSGEKEIVQNRRTYDETVDFADRASTPQIRFFPLIFENLPRKHAGVGLARKIGMDLAIQHFLRRANPDGIIVSLDADCTVSENYFLQIREAYLKNRKLCATIHNFHHRAADGDPQIEAAARQYERYIRYFEKALRYTGFPYYWHTIGSAFSVAAQAYARAGGMGRQQGGEDFYFLQKVFPLGQIETLEDVFVYPAARLSGRVPFGTGPALQRITAEPGETMRVYSMQAFRWLKCFFDMKDSFFKNDIDFARAAMQGLPSPLHTFLREACILDAIDDCNRNSATLAAYRKRFFHHFNAFRIIKCLNWLHSEALPLDPLDSADDQCREEGPLFWTARG